MNKNQQNNPNGQPPGQSISTSAPLSPPVVSRALPSSMGPIRPWMSPGLQTPQSDALDFHASIPGDYIRLPFKPTGSPAGISKKIGVPQFDSEEMLQRRYKPGEVLSATETDWPCRVMGPAFLLQSLKALMGLSDITPPAYRPWLLADVQWFISEDFDFGSAYAAVRQTWTVLLLPDSQVDLKGYRTQVWEMYKKMMHRRRNILHQDPKTGHEVILEPYVVIPHRIWDLKSNRVVDYIMMFSNWFIHGSASPKIADPNAYPPFWAVTHSWVKESNSEVLESSVNGFEWPIPLPRGVSIDQVRKELLAIGGNEREGSDYFWIDILCLRQKAGPAFDQIRAQEWKLDVPTIGNVYRIAKAIVRYLNGLGCEFKTTDWDDDRHWLRRAWTLQEIRPAEETHTGGVPPHMTNYMNASGMFEGQLLTLRQALAPVLDLGKAVNRPGGCTVYDLAREMARRCASNEVDKVGGLFYLLRTQRLPAYSATINANDAWFRCFEELPVPLRVEILFDFPYRGNWEDKKCWYPTWSQLMNWPVPRSDITHNPTQGVSPMQPITVEGEIAQYSWLFVPSVTLITNVELEATEESGEYVASGNRTRRGRIGFMSPYINTLPIQPGKYTLAAPNLNTDGNWAVCIQEGGGAVVRHAAAPGVPEKSVQPTVLRKVGVLRTDAVSQLNARKLLVASPCLFI